MNRRTLLWAISLILATLLGIGSYSYISWQNTQPVEAEQLEELNDQALTNLGVLQLELEADIAAQPRSEVEDRLESPLGQALFRRCSEWTEFYDNHPDEEVLGHRDEACGEYRDYVENGTLPEGAEETEE